MVGSLRAIDRVDLRAMREKELRDICIGIIVKAVDSHFQRQRSVCIRAVHVGAGLYQHSDYLEVAIARRGDERCIASAKRVPIDDLLSGESRPIQREFYDVTLLAGVRANFD